MFNQHPEDSDNTTFDNDNNHNSREDETPGSGLSLDDARIRFRTARLYLVANPKAHNREVVAHVRSVHGRGINQMRLRDIRLETGIGKVKRSVTDDLRSTRGHVGRPQAAARPSAPPPAPPTPTVSARATAPQAYTTGRTPKDAIVATIRALREEFPTLQKLNFWTDEHGTPHLTYSVQTDVETTF